MSNYDLSQLPEIRARLQTVEEPFLVFGGTADGVAFPGVDLIAMQKRLSRQSFNSYLEVVAELRRSKQREKPKPAAVAPQDPAPADVPN